ncbi:phage terminase small subunit P27 family [Parvibaculum sp. MBR-TMA-1.3b-4.2]|jgi:P27 family predicted phage terminase small subunit
MGRPPKPDAVKKAQGNPGKRKIASDAKSEAVQDEYQPVIERVSDVIEPPEWLKQEDARKVWYSIAPELQALRFLTTVDGNALGRYCATFSRWLKAWRVLETLDEEYYETESKHGTMKRLHPAFAAEARLSKQLIDLETQFGLTPASRQQLKQRMASQLPLPLKPTRRDEEKGGAAGEGTEQPASTAGGKRSPVDYFH